MVAGSYADNLASSELSIDVLVEHMLNNRAQEKDIAIVQRQLGRYPRGILAVGARCICGNPLAVVTRPLLPGGIPFPTTCYLTAPEAVKAISQLEANGVMEQMNTRLSTEQTLQNRYELAHRDYLTFRGKLAQRLGDDESHIDGISAGGMPKRIKCLHALSAQSLVMGSGINPFGDEALAAVRDQFNPNYCRCALPWPQSSEGDD